MMMAHGQQLQIIYSKCAHAPAAAAGVSMPAALLLASVFAVMVDLLFFKNLICIDLL